MDVIVTVYEHKRGSDICVFKTEEASEIYRQDIAYYEWDREMGDTVEKPDNLKELADVYFDDMADQGREYFRREKITVQD